MRGPRTLPGVPPSPARVPASGPRSTSPGLGRGDTLLSLLPNAGEGGRRPDEGARHAARRSTLTRPGPAAGPGRPLPASGEVTPPCPFSPTREKVAEGRMRGPGGVPDAQPSPARAPRAGPGRPLPASGEVTPSCPFSPTREKVAEGRMRGPGTLPGVPPSPARVPGVTRATSPGLGRSDTLPFLLPRWAR